MNTPVNFDLAKLLEERGFNKSTHANWWILAKDHSKKLPVDESKIFFAKDSYELGLKTQIDEETEHNYYHVLSVPTISEVVMWLYEKHGIWIYSVKDYDMPKFNYGIQQPNSYSVLTHLHNDFNSPTEAYESGIEYVLKNIIK